MKEEHITQQRPASPVPPGGPSNGGSGMSGHLRASLWLLGLTLLLCAVLYPLALLGVGEFLFPVQAKGSLVDENGEPVTDPAKARGSRLIAQGFSGDEYFQPRPSHAGAKGYDAAASGASNWGASNPLLRDRVARQLGPIVRYGPGAVKDGKKEGELVGPDVEKWFRDDVYRGKPGIIAQWAALYPGLAEAWVKGTGEAVKAHGVKSEDPAVKSAWEKKSPGESFAAQWQEDFPELYARWRRDNPGLREPSTADLAKGFFATYPKKSWPYLGDEQPKGGPKRKKLYPVTRAGEVSSDQNEIQAVFFDLWRQAHPDIDLLPVPGDMVTASGSGLDPHITLKNALYQARWRVAGAWTDILIKERKLPADAARRKGLEEKVHQELVRLLNERASAPLGGLAGVPLVNVLEVNLALRGRMGRVREGE
jgi:potassium-transporting ATPase KdpC subunit